MRIAARIFLGVAGLLTAWGLVSEPSRAAPSSVPAPRDPKPVAAAIDKIIDQRIAADKITASPLADDAEFLRRVTLDITGRIPSADATVAFLADSDPAKRAKVIDALLADHEYGEHFGTIWYHRIVKPDDDNRYLISPKLQEWLADSFNRDHGWDKIVTDILTAEGERDKNPQTVFYFANVGDKKGQPEPNKVTAAASRLFLGVKLECAECHNHPFTPIKQTDFWSTAAFFTATHSENAAKKDAKAGVIPSLHEGGAMKGMKKNTEAKAPAGSIIIPDTKGKTVKAKFLGGAEPALPGKTLRPVFAAWATSPKNPFFARAAVNKLWANFFGRGIVDPVDDMRPENEPSHPQLLDLLAKEFAASGFDQKHLIRCICNSASYQRASKPTKDNKDEDRIYARMPVKVMSADMLYDSLAVALGHAAADKTKGEGKKRGNTARDAFRKFFHAEADDDVGVVEDYTHGIPQALRLMNSPQMNDTSTTVGRLMKAGGEPEKIVEGLYITALSRKPTEAETKRMVEYAAGDKDAARAYRDILWVLLNSGEFLFNH